MTPCRVLWLSLLAAAPVLADEGRARVRLPDDCAFVASEQPGPAQQCAQMLVTLGAALEASPFAEECGDLPALEAAAQGEAVTGLQFLPLARGRFLVQVRCVQGAYNEASLFFLWDERRPDDAPRLVLFPSHDGEPTARLFARDFDARKRTLWEFRKELGDGSAGLYRRFVFVGGVVTLEESVTKEGADHRDAWSFSRRSLPRGPGWVKKTGAVRGCLASLAQPRCP